MITTLKIGIIGGGNMGSSLIGGLCQQGTPPDSIFLADHNLQHCQALKAKYGIFTTTQAAEIKNIDILVLAVKPQDLRQVIMHLEKTSFFNNLLLISIAAGITTAQIQHWLGKPDYPIVRAMPNTPALIGKSITGLFATATVTKDKCAHAENLLKCVGETVWIQDEAWMDIVTALSGSGPAYFYYVMQAMIEGACALGLPKEIASKLTLNTALGSAQMALHNQKESIEQLQAKVTSKGGTTEQGIKTLKDGKLADLIAKALKAAAERGKVLSKQYD
ncbi:MAG: pyrroline-5-carboxylate reductase [Proteobacteria bacterium]|nr:pyrroline-5-carboxylate reductase [Pseudomonadota bacterium]